MCDLQGKRLKLLTINHWPEVSVINEEILLGGERNDSVSKVFDITQNSHGWLKDILDLASMICNFTHQLYIRHDNKGGDIRTHSNGSIIPSGVYENLLKTDIYDGIWAIKTMRQRRSNQVNFLPPMKLFTESLVIGENNEDISYDWDLFWNVMSPSVWMFILLISIIPSLFLAIHDILVKKQKGSFILALAERFPSVLAVTFGGKFIGRNESHRLTLLTQTICYGIVIWITFRAELTSELSVKISKVPFGSLEGILGSNYILLTSIPSNSLGQKFLRSSSDSLEAKVLNNNMDANISFVGSEKAVQLLNEDFGHPKAIYDYHEELFEKAKMHGICGLRTVWKNSFGQPGSVAFKKDFPHLDELSALITKMMEVGIYDRLLSNYVGSTETKCSIEQKEGEPLGYRKLVFLFAFLAVAYASSALCLVLEIIVKRF